MANTSYFDLYKALKADGAVQGDWNSFHKFVGAQGKQGYLNRKKLYDALKADGAVQASTYEEFNNTLFRGGQASLKAARQRNQQPNARTQAHARNNNGTASQQPQTAAQRALQMVQQPRAPKGKVSPFVQALYSEDNARRSSVERPYTMPTGKKEDSSFVQNMRQRDQRQRQFMRGAASINGQLADYERQQNTPIVDNGTVGVMKTQGQLEDELNASSQQFVDNNMGSYIDQAVSQEFDDAHKRGLQSLGNDYFTHGTGGADWFVGEKKYQQQIDPDTMIKSLSGKVGTMVQSPDFIKQVESEASRLGVDPTEYAQNSVAPKLMDKISSKLMDEDVMRRMPKGTLEYIAGGLLDSMTGALLTGLTTSKQQRLNQQQADAMTREGKNPNYQPGTWANAARGTVSFLADAPAFGAAGKVGAKVAGKLLGAGVEQAAKVANMSKIGRMKFLASQGAVSGGVTGFTYGATNAAVQNYSTGEDTSLGNTLKLMTKGGLSEAASFAVMSGMGGLVGGAGYGIGRTGMETSLGEKLKHGAQKLGYEAVKTAMEGVGMWTGGNVARLVEGENMNWSLASGLESAASAAMFKLMHAKDVALNGKRDAGEKFIPYMKKRLATLFVSDATKNSGYAFTTDEKNQLFGYGYANGMRDSRGDILRWARQANDNDPNTAAKYYDGIMKDPNVSWDTKAKFSALVMGVVPTSRPMADHITFTTEKVGNQTQGFKKYINEYAADGTLLSKHSYETKDERDKFMFRQAAFNENARLNNAYALAIGKDSDNRLTQSMFLMSKGYNTALPETEPKNQSLILGLRDKDSELYKEFRQYCVSNGIASKAWGEVIDTLGITHGEMTKAWLKEPYKRTDKEQEAMTLFRKTLSGYVFEPGKPHPEQSSEDGKDVVTDNNLGTDKPNGEAVVTELRNLKQAEAEMAQLLNDNDIFSDNFKNLQQQGLTHPQIYDWMIQNGMTEEQLFHYAKYMNQVAKVQGMQDATAKAIEENVGAFVQDWSFHGTMDGKKMNGEQALWVRDKTGRTLIVGSGDVSYDPTNGKPKEGVGDMLVCLDPNTGETVYIKVEDTTLFQNTSAADLEAYRRQQLNNANSAPYNQAAQEQAMADAANPQPKQEETPAEQNPTETVGTASTEGTGTQETTPSTEQEQPSRKFSDGSDVPMVKDSKGRPTPDYANMTPEQAAEILTQDFGESAEKVVDGQIKKAEKVVKDASKMKVNYEGEPNDILEEERRKRLAISEANKQLEHAQNIKKVMTAKKVAETMSKPEGEVVTNTEGMDEATKNFVEAPKVEGRKGTITLPNGEEISGTYYAVPAMSLIPSHDPFDGYKPHAGVPLDENGHTINDRDYYNDKSAQDTTNAAGNDYDGRAISDVPVVNPDGRVLSGNGRTMAGQIAAANGKDAKYAESRDKNAEGFGMKSEDLDKLDHARIIFVPDEPLPYTTETFAKFNRNEKKTQSNTEQAVAKAKSLSADEVGAIVAEIEGNGSLEAFFNNSNAINSLIKTLQEKGIIGQNDVAELMEGTDKLSPQGKEMVKNLLLGSIFKPETIRMLGVDSAIKNKAVAGIRAVMDNLKLGDYSLRDEIDQAIQLLYEARTGGNKVDTLLRTPEMFKDSAAERYPSISQMMALALEGKASDFRDLLNEYNHEASARNTGEGDVFGDTPTKEELIRDFLNYKEWKDYETRGNSETERGNDAEGVRETEPEAQERNDGGKPESKPSGEPAKPEDGVKAEEAEAEKDTTNPVKSIEDAAASYKEEKMQKALDDYKKAKESGDEEQITKAAKTLKHLMDDNLKEKGYSLNQRQAAIAMQVGKKEAEIIDKPFEEMDLEEREFTASKNPLTESEINELTSEENKDLIPAALDYLHGNTDNVVGLISYLKIWNDVRNRHENAPDNSGAKDGTQLDPSDNGSGEGLGLGTGRDSGGSAGQVDRGASNEPSSGERESGESGKNDPTLLAGEQSNKQGEGDSPRMDDVSSRSAESNGGSGTGKDGNVSKRGGRKGSGGPASKNAERKPTAKQGTHFPNSTAEQLKKEREEYEQKKKDFWDRWKKAGQGYVKIALTPFKKLNLSPKQIEMLPELIKMHLHGGFLKIKEGMFKFNEWKKAMLDEEGKELKMIGMSDDDIDRFIDDYWNTPYEMDGEKHTLGQWSSIYGSQKLREKLAAPLAEKRQRQMDAEPIKVKVGDRKNIEETLPYLLPQQQEDVYKAETQFFGKEHADRDHAYGKGYMFTNGTGTGKTYTGLGLIKRLTKQGKGRILIVTPSGQKVKDWIDDGKNLNLNIRDLNDWAKEHGTTATTESGEGCVITTFANFGLNKKLLETEWDAVIYDESHRIMENKKGAETARSMQHYKVTNRDESHCFLRLQDINPHYQKMQDSADKFAKQRAKEMKRITNEYKKAHPSATDKDVNNATYKMMPKDINSFAPADAQTFPKLGKLYNDFKEAQTYYYNEVKPKLEKQAKDTWKNTKTIFLSATPFNTRENLDYAEGYIFKYPEDDGTRMPGRTRFYLDHFGAAYKFRYNRLEQSISNPEAVAKQEVAFSDYLQNNLGTMSGRIIDSPYDYSRDFPTVAPDHADAFNNAVQECLHTRHLYSAYMKTIGDYNYGSALFETMKVANSINRIKEHLAAGRKVVVYHRRVESKEPIRPPFEYMLDVANRMISQMRPGKEKDEFIAEANEFREKHQDLLQWEQTLDYSMPREQIAKAFGEDNVLFFSGKESDKVKKASIKAFNEDESGKNILVIQEASGKEGISLHDTTGNHQRVVITLALPQSPITALQIEGRIYRIGNMSNAIFEYPILGLNSEMMLFGQKFNNQVSTTENLALGSQARNLRDSFAKGILEHSGIIPIDQQGVGGKAFDAPKQEGDSDPFDDAVLDYYSNQKLNKDNRVSEDYFPTPEPLGYKMVQWAGLGEGDSVLEPSAGHGAIARYVPRSNELMSIEPSQNLFSRLQLKVGGFGRKFLNNRFENYDIHNKHDAVIMNPPFGKNGGSLAIAHLDKAFKHLDEGGRVVALIPRGMMDKRLEKWLEQNKDAVLRAEVNLPDITFQQAGTSVMSRVIVFDKVSSLSMREKAGSPEKIDLSGHYDKIEDFFEDLRNLKVPDRIIDTNFKMQKKSRQTVKDIKDIKGVRKVELDKHGITVKISGDPYQYGMVFAGSENAKFFKDNMASYYKMYDNMGQKVGYDDTQKAVFDELKKLSCKLAGMTEEEMQRYIKSGGSDGTTHFREDRGVQYSKTDAKDVKNSRIIPEDVDKSVSSQIEKKFDDEISRLYGDISDMPGTKDYVEFMANKFTNRQYIDTYDFDKQGNKTKTYAGLNTIVESLDNKLKNLEEKYGIRKDANIAELRRRIVIAQATKGHEARGVEGVSQGTGMRVPGMEELQLERGVGKGSAPTKETSGRESKDGGYERAKEILDEYVKVATDKAAAERARSYLQKRYTNFRRKYGLEEGDWASKEQVERMFKDYNSDKDVQKIFDRIKGLVDELGTKLKDGSYLEKGTEGFYYHKENYIHIDTDLLSSLQYDKQGIASTICHEMLHVATSDIIAMYQKGYTDKLTPEQVDAAKEAVDLFNEIKNTFKEKGWKEPYALTNAREFFTELANPEWRAALKKIKNGDSWWKRAIKSIAKMLGFKTSTNKLDEAEKILDNLLSNFGKEQFDFATKYNDELFADAQSKKVEDKDELDRLNKEKTFRMYSGMQELDGKLYSPMAAIIDGKRTDATEIGAWMAADERPDLVKNGKFTLVKTDKAKGAGEGDVPAAYNPYMHTSTSMMNDQFTGAYARGNIKVVEWEIPESEKTSGYRAEGAKDAVGMVPWHSGSVNSLLPKDRQRSVMLSRWRKAVRVVPDSEVAESIAQQLKGTGLAIPWNVVTPNQLRELAKIGVPITTVESGKQSPEVKAKFEAQMEDLKKEFPQSKFVDVKMTKDAFKGWGKNGGTHFREDRSSEDLYNSLKDKRNNRKEYNGTVTELANRVKQGTARIVREGKEDESGRTVNRRESLPAIAGRILLSENQQSNGQTGGRIREASRTQGKKVLQNNAVYGQIEEWAKENGCYFPESDIAKESLDGDVWKNGWEANVYRSKDGKSVIKVMPLDNLRDTPIAYSLDRNHYFNEIFPDTAIEVLGYGKDNNGEAAVIFKQPLVEGKTVLEYFNGNKEAANDYIDKYLEERGYTQKVEHDEWGCMANTNGKYSIFDVNDENVIIDKDGKPHVIDAEVLPVDYKNDGKIEIKDSESTHFRAEDAVRIADDAPVVVKHVDNIAKKVGGKVKMVQSVGEITNKAAKEAIEAGKNITGWYDEKTGEVHLYMPNIHDRYTAEKTIWHEVVGHKGMRKLIGDENYSKFLRGLWYDLDKPENARLKELVSEELKYNPFDFENGIEEGIARLVEDGKGEPGFWNNIKNKVTDLLHEIGYRVAPNTKDVKYLLWLAKNVQKHPDDLVWKMRAEAVRYKLAKENTPAMIEKDGVFYGNDGKGHSFDELTKKDFETATDGEIHLRTTPSSATALDRYHESLNKHGYMFTESYMDNMLSLKNLMQAIVPDNKNIADIKSSENPYILQNTMQGAMSNAAQMFERNVMKPLDKAMAGVLDAFEGKKDEDKIKNFNLYMITKHGLERNRVLFMRDALKDMKLDPKKSKDVEELEKDWWEEIEDLDNQLSNGSIDLKEYFGKMDEFIRYRVDDSYKADDHDYSGIHAIQEVEKDSDPYNDAEAIASVMDAEANMESIKKGSVKDFWDKVKAATQYSLDCDYKNGLMDKDLYDHVSGMFNWYVPLRKYDEKTAEDTYGYITEKGDPKNFIGKTIMRAKGRKSLSETNVLAQIGAMGNRAINNGGQNAIKQAFARFIRSHSDNNLVTETSVWYVDDPKTQTTTERYPEIPEDATPDEVNQIVKDFNMEMQELQAKGLASKVRRRGNIGYRFQKAENKSQHLVDVMIAGKKHTFVINGNPRAAQALNGLLEHKNTTFLGKAAATISRVMAQTCTSYNPEFVMRNMVRDFEFASSNLLAKEGFRYTTTFEKYYAQVGLIEGIRNTKLKDFKDTGGFGLFAKYRNGTLDTSDKIQRYFKEFMENGGETGWVQVKNMKDLTKEYKAHIKSERNGIVKVGKGIYDAIFKNLENANEIAENMARFSTYCASRDYGRSIVRSTYDAKEVSTNFNRHGSGGEIKSFKNGEMGTFKNSRKNFYGFSSSYLRNCSMFFNAGIQSTNLLVKNLKTSPVGTGAYIMAAPFVSGALMALVNNMIIAGEDEKERNGVKDPYGELPDYIRKNNLCIYTGGGEFITIPLAIEERAFYGLGDLAAGMTFSPNIKTTRSWYAEGIGCASQLVPVLDYLGNKAVDKDFKAETLKATLPSATSPFVEWAFNSDWKGAPIERENSFDKNQPAWMRAYHGTPEVLIDLNKWVNAQTNDIAKGNEDMLGIGFLDAVTNPSGVQHYYSGFLGGAATFVERSLGLIKHGSETETKDIPFVRSLLYTPSEQTSLQRTKSKWYNYKDELETTMANVDRLKAKNVPIDKRLQNMADYYHFQNSSDAAKVRIIDLAEKQMKQWKKMRDRATDTESVNFANQNIDRIMMEAVEELDRME